MRAIKKYKHPRRRRQLRVRGKVKGSAERPRLSVFRSSKHIYAQVIDDDQGRTLLSASDLELISAQRQPKKTLSKTERAFEVGRLLAKKAQEIGIKKVVFDRSGYRYHGRVKALAEGLRKGGLRV